MRDVTKTNRQLLISVQADFCFFVFAPGSGPQTGRPPGVRDRLGRHYNNYLPIIHLPIISVFSIRNQFCLYIIHFAVI